MNNNGSQEAAKHKRAGWARGADIALRSVHLGVAGVLLGGVIFQQPLSVLHYWGWWTVGTGLGLIASEVYHSWRWPYQGRGVMVMLHIACVALVHVWFQYAVQLMWAALIIGAVGSHMPRKYRHWSFLDGQVMD
ncbi:hypothetical protein Pcar_2757 [Syntrophotalea carbinolica DSM 2380]|uniref:Uncharacterized protein n=1 Tax=Syntrophotalea carbinolica (strain DSM 2380 / NBRC 103641 / GraBd1) TaxID=338963 RepID=Q3A0W5_SYNC1|nr:hypothetical protein [Syntrophotalea carbinolica]ABA89992.1 hypothetical protein Pcar_2757 [Syntrophotalea carbinolica DSM 2380]